MTSGLLEAPPRIVGEGHPPPGPSSPPRSRPEIGLALTLLAAAATLLTATGMTRVFEGVAWWFLPCVGAVVTAGASGLLGRLARVPLAAMPLVYLLGLAFYASAMSAPATRAGGFVPTSDSWTALRDLASVGAEDVRRLAVPVPERPGLVLLVVLGTYAVACAVDVICTRLQSPATAGLPLLALIAVPAALVPGDIGLRPFLAAALGYILLLAADGRRGHRTRSGGGRGGGRARGTVRIAVLALAAAVLLPLVLPGPGSGLIAPDDGAAPGLGGSGSGRARVVQPFVTLDQQLRSDETVQLMRVRTDSPEYLRLTSLELFDGSRFTLGRLQADPAARVSNGLPAPGPVRSSLVTGEVRVRDLYRQRYLPVPYAPTAISVSGDWRLHGPTSTVFSGRTDTGGTRYSYTSAVPAPSPADLRSEPPATSLPPEVATDLRLPGVDRAVRRLALQLTASEPTTFDKVAAIQAYLRSPLFTYDLNGAPTNGRDALRTFLLETRRGYCEQFASAMAVLVRSINIPARVAIGFTPGTRDSNGDWVITNRDAHAWPEVWFPNAGWVRFEPTPRDDSTEVPPDYSVPPPPGTDSEPSLPNEGTTIGGGSPQLQPLPPAADSAPGAGDRTAKPGPKGAASPLPGGWLAGGGLAVLAGVLVAAGPAFRLRRRRRRLASGRAHLLWQEVVDTADDLGVGPVATESPRAAATRWATAIGEVDPDGRARATLGGLARQEEHARYARHGADAPATNGPGRDAADDPLARDAGHVLAALEHASGRRQRLRAWLLPRSAVSAGATALARLRTRMPRMGGSPGSHAT